MPLIETKDLSFLYAAGTPFEKKALDRVSIAVEKGEFLGIIGQTGSGKSTLVQHLNGLLRPSCGQVLLEGRDIWEKPKEIRSVRFKVGMVFQYPEHQLFENTVYQDIAFGPKNMGLDEQETDRRVREAADIVDLDEALLQQSPFDLSGGQKRRAAIAGVMSMQPEVLILDEPTAGLDPRGRIRLLDEILAYKKKTGATVLLVSHNMEDVARCADRVLVMHQGRPAMLAPTAEVFSRAQELEEMGLTVPAVTRIFMQLRACGVPVGDNVYNVRQAAERLTALLKGGGRDAH